MNFWQFANGRLLCLVLNFQIGELFAATPAEITFTFQSMLCTLFCKSFHTLASVGSKMATFITIDSFAKGQAKL